MASRIIAALRTPGSVQSVLNGWMVGGWARKTIYSLLDQACFSGSMLLLNILLARWSSPDEYGIFAVNFAIFLILSGIHNALIIEPMSVFGPIKPRIELPDYLRQVYLLHIAVVIGLAIIAGVFLYALGGESPTATKWVLPVALPMALSFWLVRRTCYVASTPRKAFTFSLTYALMLLTGLFGLQNFGLLSSTTAFLLFGFCSCLTSLPSFWRVLCAPVNCAIESIRSAISQHWTYGKWASGESIMFALGTSIYPLLIAYFGSVAQAGEFRAIQLVFMPLTHLLTSLGLIALPLLAKSRIAGQREAYSKRTHQLLCIFVGLAIVYLVPAVYFGETLIAVLYNSHEYLGMIWILPYVGVAAMFAAVSTALMISLRASQQPKHIFRATAASAVVTAIAGTWLISANGMQGLAVALVASGLVSTVVLTWSSRDVLSIRSRPDFQLR